MTEDYKKALNLIQKAKETNSTELSLVDLKIKRIPDEIADLQNLKQLNLYRCHLEDFSNLGKLPNLVYLDLRINHISDTSFFQYLQNLKILDLDSTFIENYSFLTELPFLETLSLKHHKHTTDFSFLKNIKRLFHLSWRE